MKIYILTFLILIVSGCSSESPREKAKKYLGMVDTFYVDMTDDQEKMLDQIVDDYFDSKKSDYLLNKKLYLQITKSLDGGGELNTQEMNKIINQKIEINKSLIPKQLKLINDFFKTLGPKQRKKMLDALEKLRKKSVKMRFWLGEEQ